MTIEKSLRRFVLAGIFAMPFLALVVVSSTYFPYVAGRAFGFRILVDVMTPPWLLLLAASPADRPRGSPIALALAAFAASLGLSALLGVNVHRSFWGTFERMEGWMTLAHLVLLFAMMASVMRTDRVWRAYWFVTIAVSLVACGWCFAQAAGWLQGGMDIEGRFGATMGNPSYLAVYLLLHIFLTSLVTVQAFAGAGRRGLVVLCCGCAAIAMQIAALTLTGTRAALLGLACGVVVAGFVLLTRRVRLPSSSPLLSAVAGVGTLALIGAVSVIASFTPAFDRIRTASLGEGPILSRLLNWRLAWSGFLEKPVFGWGQENYRYVFERFYEPSLYATEFRFDRPHNVVLEWLVAGGVVGLCLYLSLFFATAFLLFTGGRFRPAERGILTGLAAAYLICNFFMFDNLASYVLFIAILAYVHDRSAPAERDSARPDRAPARWWIRPGLAAAAAISAGLAYTVNANALRANVALASAMKAPYGEALPHFSRALSYDSFGAEDIRRKLAATAVKASQDPAATSAERDSLATLAHSELDRQIAADPDFGALYLVTGAMLTGVGRYDEAMPYLLRARAISPRDQVILIYLGLNARGRKAETEAIGYFCEAYAMDRTNASTKAFCPGT